MMHRRTVNQPVAPTGDLDHHLSTSLQQIPRLSFEMPLEECQRPARVFVQQDPHQFDEVIFLDRSAQQLLQDRLPSSSACVAQVIRGSLIQKSAAQAEVLPLIGCTPIHT
jgi:hypothetical protein